MGTLPSAAGGRRSEAKGVAAVEILGANSEQKISGTATGHNGAPRYNISKIWRRIEVVITGLTRNQFAGNGTWVRIPPSPPKNNHHSDTTEWRLFYTQNRFLKNFSGEKFVNSQFYPVSNR